MRGPGIHGHSPDPALPTARTPQGTPSTPACWRHCWRRQGWRISTCRTPPTGTVPSLDMASLWSVGLGGAWNTPHPCLGHGSLISVPLEAGGPQPCPAPPQQSKAVPAALPCFCREPECTQPAVGWFSVPELPAEVAEVLVSGNWTPESPSPACQCSQPGARRLLPHCSAAAGGPPPPQALTGSGEVVQNLTGRNLSDFLVKTYPRLVHQG